MPADNNNRAGTPDFRSEDRAGGFKPRLPSKAPTHVGQFDGKAEGYDRWLARYEPWAATMGLTDQQTKDFSICLLTGAAQEWADHRARRPEFQRLNWSEFKAAMCRDLCLHQEEIWEKIWDEPQKYGQALRPYCDRKCWAGEQLGRSDEAVKRAIVRGISRRFFPALTHWRSLDLAELEGVLLDYEELDGLNTQPGKRKRSPSPKQGQGESCPTCKKQGHVASDCWYRPGGPRDKSNRSRGYQ